jgi:acetyl-CoA synthetase
MPTFQRSREFLLANRTNYDKAVAGFQWPEPVPFNWALEWFDAELARAADSKDRCALWIVDVATGRETKLTFAQLAARSNQVANYLRQQGLKRGDHLLLVLNNVAPLWEIMLAAMKLGVVVIPATTLLTGEELADRVERGRARMIVSDQDQVAKCAGLSRDGVVFVTTSLFPIEGWRPLSDAYKSSAEFTPDGPTNADDPLLLYFTSGTTAKPKLVRHSHRSDPVGALSTMYWLG